MTREWSDAVRPIVARFQVAAQFGANAVFNTDGAEAAGKLLESMATILDDEIEARRMKSTTPPTSGFIERK